MRSSKGDWEGVTSEVRNKIRREWHPKSWEDKKQNQKTGRGNHFHKEKRYWREHLGTYFLRVFLFSIKESRGRWEGGSGWGTHVDLCQIQINDGKTNTIL